eukprot:6718571-Pyramimonas_sp.AAC.1
MCSARSSHESRVEWKVLCQLQRFGGRRSRFQVEGLRIRRGPQGEVLVTSGDLSEALTDYFCCSRERTDTQLGRISGTISRPP